MNNTAAATTPVKRNDFVHLSSEPLNVSNIITNASGDKTAGAINVFIGTTRDTFNGKNVIKLEYEAYNDMALKQLTELCRAARQRVDGIHSISIVHRIGIVPPAEASVVIVVVSTHRRESFSTTEWLLEELKREVAIWKKEIYKGDEASWKQNDVAFAKSNEGTNGQKQQAI